MKLTRCVVAACVASLALAASPFVAGQPVAGPSQEVLAADLPTATADGNTFVAPMEWGLLRKENAVILAAPEGDSHLALVDAGETDADGAVAAAWAAYDPDAEWPFKLATDRPPRDGWEERKVYDYEVSANEKRFVQAVALRRGSRWTVVIYDMSNATGEKRLGQVEQVFDRLLPKGYSRESFAGKTAHAMEGARLDALKSFVEQARGELGVPGVAVGIVQDGRVVFADGFGVRALGKPDKVDGDTLFMVASNTKAMTTLMLARLVEQGRFDWDTPVTQLLPGFRLGDADTTRQVRVEHLVCACTGLPRQDFEWLLEFADATAASTLGTLATMQPTSAFGELFQYSNPLASAGGYVGAHVLHPDMELGAAYDRAMRELVFGPLGMDATTFDFAQALRGNHAAPHAWNIDGAPSPANMAVNYAIVPVRPAGGAWSSVNDMLRYVRMELDKGLLAGGERYIPEPALLERRRRMVAIGNDVIYGMGLETDTTWGIPVVHHGGSMLGYKSDMLWLPGHGVGAVILTNADEGGRLLGPFQRRLLELLFDGEEKAAAEVAAAARASRERLETERKRLVLPADDTEAARLAGSYANEALGELTVKREAGRTVFDFGEWNSEVASRRNDDGTLSFVTVSPGISGLELVVADAEDGTKRLVMRSSQQEYVFESR